MQVSSSTNTYQYQLQDASKDAKREVATNVASYNSKQSQIDAYVAGTQNANESYNNTENSQNSTQNYMEFSSDLRKAEGYNILVDNGVNPIDINKPPLTPSSIQPIDNPVDYDDLSDSQADAVRQAATGIAGYRSKEAQMETYTSSSQESEANPYSSHEDTQDYIQNYNNFSQEIRRSEYITTYIDNNTSPLT